ncbi:hypothetical protein [Paenibacillus xylaniclasticus]|nr:MULTISPECIES: hypothetical protein [Paenibacillus]
MHVYRERRLGWKRLYDGGGEGLPGERAVNGRMVAAASVEAVSMRHRHH